MAKLRYATTSHALAIAEMLNDDLASGMATADHILPSLEQNSYLIIEDSSELIGFIQQESVRDYTLFRFYPSLEGKIPIQNKYNFISNFYVKPSSRNKGYGSRLLSAALSCGAGLYAVANSLHRPEGWKAETLFNTFGFVNMGELEGYYSNPCDSGIHQCKSRCDYCRCRSFVYVREPK